MWSGIVAALQSLKLLLGLFSKWQADVEHEKTKEEGKAEQTAANAGKIEEARRERQKLDTEVRGRSDADLDASLDKWMRD